MKDTNEVQDYSLIGETGKKAESMGLAQPRWFRPKIDPAEIRHLSQKNDARATKDTVLWIGLMVLFAGVGIALWPSWWSVPFWLAYGVLYGSASDSRWHECGHRTAFKTVWKNKLVYQIASFMLVRNPVVWRASHARHHTDTIIVGRDPEIVAMRPPDLMRLFLNLFGLIDTWNSTGRMLLHAAGRIHTEEASYVPQHEHQRVFWVARIWLSIYAATIAVAIFFGSWLPLMVIGLPRLYGAWHHVLTGVLQHLALAENVTDHRLNTRTVLMNPVTRFIYLNMNYHLEHHMFTMVPYYNLPALHELIKHECPAPDPSIYASFRRILPVLFQQLRYRNAVIVPKLPDGATPYRSQDIEKLRPHAV